MIFFLNIFNGFFFFVKFCIIKKNKKIRFIFIFKVNSLLKENNVNGESAIVQDNILSVWTCNTTNSRGNI